MKLMESLTKVEKSNIFSKKFMKTGTMKIDDLSVLKLSFKIK